MSWAVDVEAGIEWIETHTRVHDAQGGGTQEGVPVRLSPGQKRAIRKLPSMRLEGGTDCTCKARQVQFSTACLLWAAFLMVSCPGIGILMVAPEGTLNEFRDVKWRIIVESLLLSPGSGWSKPTPKNGADNEDEYRLPNGSRIAWADAGGTKAKASKAGLGGTYHWAIFSELAKWDWGHETMRVILPALEAAGASVTVDSTPPENAGQGAAYLDLAREAYAGTDPSTRFYFWPWWFKAEYRAATPAENPTAKERELMEARGWDLFQLQWRREKMAHPIHGPTFLWVYPETPEQALRPKGSAAFEEDFLRELVERIERNDFPAPLSSEQASRLLFERFGESVKQSFLTDPKWGQKGPEKNPGKGYGRIWLLPKNDNLRPLASGAPAASVAPPRYWLGVDSAKGTKDGDWQVGAVTDQESEHCATLRCRVKDIVFAGHIQRLATLYDWAHIEFEQGGGIGSLVQRYIAESVPVEECRKYGADPILAVPYPEDRFYLRPNNQATKTARVSAAMLNLPVVEIRDPDLVDEMLLIDPETGKARSGPNNHEDYFDAMGISWAGRQRVLFQPKRRPSSRFAYGSRRTR